jgi:2,4-dienoyl-CoA reductase-like NADH-dependent reductase (Old Yellow Enzyme family)
LNPVAKSMAAEMKIEEYAVLFTPCQVGHKLAPNRLAAQPMEANDGTRAGGVSELTLRRYINLARGPWGIVFVEAVSITEASLGHKNGLVLNRGTLDDFKRLVDAFKTIHPHGLLMIQLTHSGILSGSFSRVTSVCPLERDDVHYLSTDEIEGIRQAFVEGALMAEEAGADGIDFKLGHGYLGTEMLRPANTREDRWGGDFENRTRFLRESIQELKSRLQTRDFILGSRVSLYEGIRGGCGTAGPDEIVEDLAEMKQLVLMMDTLGMDYINVTAGLPAVTTEMSIPAPSARLFFLDQFRYAKTVKDMQTSLKVIGSAYSILKQHGPAYAAENIRKGYVDFAGFGRQTFADPDYPRKLKAAEKINYCTACSGCGKLIDTQMHAGCIIYNDYYRDLYRRLQT